MGEPTLSFSSSENPLAYELYQGLVAAGMPIREVDRGYSRTNYAGVHCPNRKARSCVYDAGNGKITPEEIWEFALNRHDKYRQLIEGVLDRPLPWVLDDLKPNTTFDADIRQQVSDAIQFLQSLIERQPIPKGTPNSQERLAVGLYYLVSMPRKQNLPRTTALFEEKTSELQAIGLSPFVDYLREHGGLRVDRGVDRGVRRKEYSALEAMQIEEGDCSEKSKILFAVFAMAGLSPFFVEVNPWKTDLPYMKNSLQQSRSYSHVCVGLRFGRRVRLFDPAILESAAPHREYYALTLRQFLSAEYSERGLANSRRGEWKSAEEEYAKASLLDPFRPAPYVNRSMMWIEKNDVERAIREDSRAIELDPQNVVAYANRCHDLGEKGQFKEALADCHKALELNPAFPVNYLTRADIWQKLHAWDLVIWDCTEAIKLNPALAAAYGMRGNSYANKGEFALALEDFNTALQLRSEPAEAVDIYINRGLVWEKKREWDRAIADYSRAIERGPGVIKAYHSRGIVWMEKGERDKALADFTVVLRLSPQETMQVGLALESFFTRQWEASAERIAASQHIVADIGSLPASVESTITTAAILWSAGDEKQAVDIVQFFVEHVAARQLQQNIALSDPTREFLRRMFMTLPKPLQSMPEIRAKWQPVVGEIP